nr:MAG TPA: hypothetical protein [Caudoviricetes sp.]
MRPAQTSGGRFCNCRTYRFSFPIHSARPAHGSDGRRRCYNAYVSWLRDVTGSAVSAALRGVGVVARLIRAARQIRRHRGLVDGREQRVGLRQRAELELGRLQVVAQLLHRVGVDERAGGLALRVDRRLHIAATLRLLGLHGLSLQGRVVAVLHDFLLGGAAALLGGKPIFHDRLVDAGQAELGVVAILQHVALHAKLVTHQAVLVAEDFGGVKTVGHLAAGERSLKAGIAVAPQAAAHHAEYQEEHDDPEETAVAEETVAVAILIGHGRDVGKRHIVHLGHSFFDIYLQPVALRAKESFFEKVLHLLGHLLRLLQLLAVDLAILQHVIEFLLRRLRRPHFSKLLEFLEHLQAGGLGVGLFGHHADERVAHRLIPPSAFSSCDSLSDTALISSLVANCDTSIWGAGAACV